jgi:hypothetical protein
MSKLVKIILIVFAVSLELIFCVEFNLYPHGEIFAVKFRNQERYLAWQNYRNQPSPISKSEYNKELRLMNEHENWKHYAVLGVIVIVNGIGIYYFLRNRKIEGWSKNELDTPTNT